MTSLASPSIPTSEFPRTRSRSPIKSTPTSPELRRKTSSASISDLGSGIPRPPSAADLRPNAYPYPIATTATGVLSRSNSLSSPASGKHHYVPPSPGKEFDGGAREGRDGGSGGKGRRGEYRGHRYSRSLSSSEDMFLASSPAGANREYNGTGSQGPRALPVPPGVSANSIAAMNAAAAGSYSAYAVATSGIPPTRGGSTSPSRGRVSAVYETEEPGELEDEEEGTPSHRRRTMSVPIASPFPTSPSARQSPFASRYEPTDTSPSPPHPPGRFRNGRVKGMVRSFESSGSESGSPERERRTGSGFRPNGSGSGFVTRRSQSQSEGEDDAMGGTVRPQPQGNGNGSGRALPVRPDGADLGATVRGYEPVTYTPGHRHANGILGASGANGGPKEEDEEELTVEELIAREDAAAAMAMAPNYTGGGGGAWGNGNGKPKRGVVTPNHTGNEARHPTGGRPLPAQPPMKIQRGNSSGSGGGVHAWEADEGAVGSTVKRVREREPAQRRETPRTWIAEQLEATKGVDATPEGSLQGEGGRAKEVELEPAQQRAQDAKRDRDLKLQRDAQQWERERDAEERGRARGAAVRAQLEEAADLRALVDAFRARLEEVERRVGEMEAVAAVADKKGDGSGSANTTSVSGATTTSGTTTTITQRLDPRRLLALFAQAPGAAGRNKNAGATKSPREGRDGRDDWVGPTTLGGLPSYVLLVGLGVCAVVLRVLVRKGLGLGAGAGAVRRGAGAA
ncbi:hypothetical protein B0H12DRAFT_1326515 [Mycena haematopus]|nr:hypothetical protein B0H12DRAFT_1326515 [Mycena haematopus]